MQDVSADFKNLKNAFDVLKRYSPDGYNGYMQMRSEIFPVASEGALPVKFKHLLFALFDLERGFDEGAQFHVKEALNFGMTVEELTEALLISLMLTGVSTYLRGYGLIPWVEEYLKTKASAAGQNKG